MRAAVLLHVALLRERLRAEVAGERLEAAVHAQVRVEVGALREPLAAQLAAVAELLVVRAVNLRGRAEQLSIHATLEE